MESSIIVISTGGLVCVYVVVPFILDVRVVDAPAGVTQEEGHTGFLPSVVVALIFLARRALPLLSFVDREAEGCAHHLIIIHLL